MAARELLDDLATAKVSVWVEEGRLKYKAEPGALTEDLKARTQALRADVVAVLEGRAQRNNSEQSGGTPLPPRHPDEQRVDRDLLEDVKAWKRWAPLPAFGDQLEAIARAWGRTKAPSLKAEYERLAGWAYYEPEVVTAEWLAAQQARYQARPNAGRPMRPVRALTPEEVEAFAWALDVKPADLPPFPFRLRIGTTVTGPRWLPELQAEIRRGAADRRVRGGATLLDVQGLREAIATAATKPELAELRVVKKRRSA